MVDEFFKEKEKISAIAINLDMVSEGTQAAAFKKEKGLQLPMLYVETDDANFPVKQLEALEIRAVPTNFFLDGEGVIRSVRLGAISKEDLEKFEKAFTE